MLLDTYAPETPHDRTKHAGRVFVLTSQILTKFGCPSDDTDPTTMKDRLYLCIWDLSDGTSIWLSVQSGGTHTIPNDSKLNAGTRDPNWMDNTSHHNIGTLWKLGTRGNPFNFSQPQLRAITRDELNKIRARFALHPWIGAK